MPGSMKDAMNKAGVTPAEATPAKPTTPEDKAAAKKAKKEWKLLIESFHERK